MSLSKAEASERRRNVPAAQLAALVERHKGNRSAIARALTKRGIPAERQYITPLLERHGLLARADELSVKARKFGPRHYLSDEVRGAHRVATLQALATATTRAAAAKKLRMGAASLYRWIGRHAITDEEIEAIRAGGKPSPTPPPGAVPRLPKKAAPRRRKPAPKKRSRRAK